MRHGLGVPACCGEQDGRGALNLRPGRAVIVKAVAEATLW